MTYADQRFIERLRALAIWHRQRASIYAALGASEDERNALTLAAFNEEQARRLEGRASAA